MTLDSDPALPAADNGRSLGRSVLRREDRRLLLGTGRFVDDVDLAGQLWLRVVRSTVAHARISSIDIQAARACPGVRLVLTAADLCELSHVPVEPAGYHALFPDLDGYAHPVLAIDRVLYVGQPVAAIVADTQYLAEDAAEAVVVDYEPLAPVLDPVAAVEAASIHPGLPNEGAFFERSYGNVDEAFRTARWHVSFDISIGRQTGVPMECRGFLVEPDSGRGQLSMWGAVHVHDSRELLAEILRIPKSAIHMRTCDIGGNFGVRGGVFPEYVLVAHAARLLDRPIKWIEDRLEHLVSVSHAREQMHHIEAAFDEEARLLGLKDEIWHNHGAYFRQSEPLVSDITAGVVGGPYRVPAYRCRLHAVMTNKTPLSAYRAPGRFETTVARERLLDVAAKQIGVSICDIRRINLLTEADLPWEPGVDIAFESFRFDSGDVLQHFDEALAAAGFASWQAEATLLRSEGRRVGNGIGVFLDKAGLGIYETGAVNIDPSGRIEVLSGSQSVGQGVETVLAQIVGDVLEVAPETIDVKCADSDLVPDGVGSWSSRSTVIGGGAARKAALKVVQRALALTSELFEIAVEDLEYREGRVSVRGSRERSLTLFEIANRWDGPTASRAGREPGLRASATYVESHMNYPFGVTVAQVEIDPETGSHVIRRLFTSTEAGRVINPAMTVGQIVGAVAQGVGGTLFEELKYDANGQPLAASLMDYLVPGACEIPEVELLVTESAPTADNPFGAKGIGEVGLIGVGAAIAGAIDDALGGVALVDHLPVHSEALWTLATSAVATANP
ncbi:MAG: xanthine dehydrogenase family protein molybdopterin-binding subunit [Acidimicrobiales bacterium]